MLADLTSQKDRFFLIAEGQRPQLGHSELTHHSPRQLGCLFDVVAGAGRHGVEEQFLRQPAPHHDCKLTFEKAPRVRVPVVHRQLLRYSQSHAARDDRHLVDRIGAWCHCRNQGVTGFMVGRDPLLLIANDQ